MFRADIFHAGRGAKKNLQTVSKDPNSHEACDAAIECGAVAAISKRKTNAARSSKRAASVSARMPANSSIRSKKPAINADIGIREFLAGTNQL
jgi:hypothetical protein